MFKLFFRHKRKIFTLLGKPNQIIFKVNPIRTICLVLTRTTFTCFEFWPKRVLAAFRTWPADNYAAYKAYECILKKGKTNYLPLPIHNFICRTDYS